MADAVEHIVLIHFVGLDLDVAGGQASKHENEDKIPDVAHFVLFFQLILERLA